MNFGLTEEQELLRGEARKFLDEQCPIDEVRRLMSETTGFSPTHWKALANLGWTGLVTPEAHGGAGLGWIDLIVVLEETGRGLFPSPLISTLLASATLDDLGDHKQKQQWLGPLAMGDEIGSLAIFDEGSEPTLEGIEAKGRRKGDGFLVEGRKHHVIDAPNATLFIVAFRDEDDALRIGLVRRDARGVGVEALEPLDRTKRIGHVTLSQVEIAADALLGTPADAAPAIERALDRGAVATTAEILGAGEQAHALTVQYAKDRVQFGSPIGRYQGVKHPLAEMYVDLESTRSLLYYAAWALEEGADEASLAASRAKAFATEAFMRIGVDSVQLHGAVGYTEEYDVQLYLKRSKWARPAFGDEAHHLERVARLGGLWMDFHYTPEEEAFREEVRKFIDEHNPPPEEREDPEALEAWHAALAAKKWIGFSWPREAGGGGGSVIEQFILKEEMGLARAPALGTDFMGLTWVGPALIAHGTEAQQQRFLPDLLACRSVWCTGYSEPDSGSDLASLKTRAVRDGDEYVVTGQKIWTTLAHKAKWIFMLVRTESSDRYGGTTCLLIDMQSPGIEVSPIPNLIGVHSFNQVFFNEVRVPVENRLGDEGKGWRVVMGALADERTGISESTVMEQHLERLRDLAKRSTRGGRPALEDPELRRQLARFECRIAAMRLNGMRHLTNQLKGQRPGSETSVNKWLRGPLEIEMSDTALGLLGGESVEDGEWQRESLNFHGTVIGGGTPNIQRNIIAERILGLPKD